MTHAAAGSGRLLQAMGGETDTCSMDASSRWMRTWRWVVGVAAVAYLAVGSYTGDGWVFPFSYADLGFHELGHALTMFWAPSPVVALSGSLVQVAVPIGLGLYFALGRKDRASAALMLAWAGASANNVSIYIHDATRRILPLLGGQSGHDWAYLLGPGVWNALGATDGIAFGVRVVSVALMATAFGFLAWGYTGPRRAARAEAALRSYRATLPVREPRNPVLRTDTADVMPEGLAEGP